MVAGAALLFLGATGYVSRTLTRRAAPIASVDHTTDAETLVFETEDGETIRAWWFGTDSSTVAVLLHGNGGSRRSNLGIARFVVGEGYAVLAPTLRAHGDSTGDVNDIGWSARHDVVAAIAEVERRRPGARIVVLGRSLGAAAFLFAAKDVGDRVAAVALESPYERLSVAVRHRTDMFLPGPISAIVAKVLLAWGPVWTGGGADRIAPVEHVAHVPSHVPIVVIAGAEDVRATLDEARAYEAARDDVRLVVIEGARHGEAWDVDRTRYQAVLRGLLDGGLGE